MGVIALGYIAVEAVDTAAWDAFATRVLGVAGAELTSADYAYYRVDERAFRIMVREGDSDRLLASGWECPDKTAFDKVVARLIEAGVDVRSGQDADKKARSVTDVAFCSDPAGNALEIFYGQDNAATPFSSPAGVPSFVTGDMGMGHVVLPAPNLDDCYRFYTELLGFALSDELPVPMPPEGHIHNLKFMHTANPRHHSLAIFEGEHPGGCIHWMLEVPDIDTVGHCMDRAAEAGVPLFATLGRHSNDNMLSVYFMAPGGIGVEYGCDGLRMDWTGWKPKVLESGDVWGHLYAMAEG